MKQEDITEKLLIGKNVHSVYTLCLECRKWGVNMPLNKECGNCGSTDTILYYDIETVSQALQAQRDEFMDVIGTDENLGEWKLGRWDENPGAEVRNKFRAQLRKKVKGK